MQRNETWLRSPAGRYQCAAALLAALFFAYYLVQRNVAGPLESDEIYFTHIIWNINQGRIQYIDFYSNHLPTYFTLLRHFVSTYGADPTSLRFVWGVRIFTACLAPLYLLMVFYLHKRLAASVTLPLAVTMAALLLAFMVLGRMIEVRADSVGLLLFNAAWALLIAGYTRLRVTLATVSAGTALLFSARALPMAAGLGLLLLYMVVSRRDWRTLIGLATITAGLIGSILVAYAYYPTWTIAMTRSVFLDPVIIMDHVGLWQRFVAIDTGFLSLLIAGGFISAVGMIRTGRRDSGLVVLVATATQLLLIAFDPSPHQYVYGWSALPAVFGMAVLAPSGSAYVAFASAALHVAAAAAYVVVKHHQPPTGSSLRLTFDAVLSPASIARASTPRLVTMMINGSMQQNLENQLRIREEVCRRVRGPVLSGFSAHPICAPDTMYYWTEVQWPTVVVGELRHSRHVSQTDFARNLAASPPQLFIWGKNFYSGRQLEPVVISQIRRRYRLYDGFALFVRSPRTVSPPK